MHLAGKFASRHLHWGNTRLWDALSSEIGQNPNIVQFEPSSNRLASVLSPADRALLPRRNPVIRSRTPDSPRHLSSGSSESSLFPARDSFHLSDTPTGSTDRLGGTDHPTISQGQFTASWPSEFSADSLSPVRHTPRPFDRMRQEHSPCWISRPDPHVSRLTPEDGVHHLFPRSIWDDVSDLFPASGCVRVEVVAGPRTNGPCPPLWVSTCAFDRSSVEAFSVFLDGPRPSWDSLSREW